MADRVILNIGNPADGNTYKVIVEGDKRVPLYGLNVGDEFKGDILDIDNLEGYNFLITGGSDDSGTPMRQNIRGSSYRRLLLKSGVGYKPTKKGERRRKRVRGEEIQDDIAQLNIKVLEEGKTALSAL